MPQPDHRPKVTIEDLLHLKRAERPAGEFWAGFERELRQKQLTALMEKRAWWQELPYLLSRKAYVPVGATAILAFTLVSVKFYAPNQVAQLDESLSVVSAIESSRQDANRAATEVAQASSPLVNRSEQGISVDHAPAIEVTATANVAAADRVEIPMLAPSEVIETPSARSIAANLARLEQSEPELVKSVMGARLSSNAPVEIAQTPVAEFASVPTGESKRSRLLAQYSDRVMGPEPTSPEIVRERIARRLADNELNDRITRVGLRGDQVSLKF